MEYEGTVYRPPSEAYSLIIQVTIGCSHNGCTFCSMYKDKTFRIKEVETIKKELRQYRKKVRSVRRIFLADGDAFILKTDNLVEILNEIKNLFPECERISSYATPQDILMKTEDEIKRIKEHGLTMLYMGVESGSDLILKEINKKVTAEEMVQAGKKAIECGMKLSVTLISGLGGIEKSKEHAIQSAKVVSAINPHYLGLLTLMVEEDTEIYKKIKTGEMKLLSPIEVMKETHIVVENLEVSNCVFRSNHASNYVSLAGNLNRDKEHILNEIKQCLNQDDKFKDERYRAL